MKRELADRSGPGSHQIVIRDALPDELDAVSRLLREAYLEYGRFIPPGAWQAYLQDIMDVPGRLDTSDLIIAKLDGKLAGAVTLFSNASRSTGEGWPEGWAGVRLLAVHPEYRRHGVGRALMEECLRRCRARGVATVGLHTTSIMDTARRMYEKMGFVRAPEFDFHPRPGVIVMAYRLDL